MSWKVSREGLRQTLEHCFDMGRLDRVKPEAWAPGLRWGVAEFAELLEEVRADRSTRVVPDVELGSDDLTCGGGK